jgi:hypothetical protein
MSKRMRLQSEEETNVSTLTHVALGTFKDDSSGEWLVAKIKFDPETGAAEVTERIPAGPGRDFAIEKFKIVAVQEGVVG